MENLLRCKNGGKIMVRNRGEINRGLIRTTYDTRPAGAPRVSPKSPCFCITGMTSTSQSVISTYNIILDALLIESVLVMSGPFWWHIQHRHEGLNVWEASSMGGDNPKDRSSSARSTLQMLQGKPHISLECLKTVIFTFLRATRHPSCVNRLILW